MMAQSSLFPTEEYSLGWDPNDYETPDRVARAMARLIKPSDIKICCPTAGSGQITQYLPRDKRVIAIEPQADRVRQGMLKAPFAAWRRALFQDVTLFEQQHVFIDNLPFEGAMELIELMLEHLDRSYKYARILALLPTDYFGALERSRHFNRLDAHIHKAIQIPGRVDYLKFGVPMSKQVNPETGKLYGARQCYDSVFDIRPGKAQDEPDFLL